MKLKLPHRVLGSAFFAPLIFVFSLSGGVSAQSLSGIKLGAAAQSVESLSLEPLAREGRGSLKMSRYQLPNGNSLAITSESRANKIIYVEQDWDGTKNGRSTGIEGLSFGVTTIADIRRKNGSNGFTWKGKDVSEKNGSIIQYNAFEITDRPGAILVFITAVDIAEVKGKKVNANDVDKLFRLRAIILASEEYLDAIWGEEKIYDKASRSIEWQE